MVIKKIFAIIVDLVYKYFKMDNNLNIYFSKNKNKRPSLSKVTFNILALVFLLVARHLYIKSLLGCDGDEFKCVLKRGITYIVKDMYYCINSALFFLLFLFIFHLKFCSFYWIIFFILIIFELIYRDTGDSFLRHGLINLSSLFILLFLGELIILTLILIIYILKSKKFYNLTQFFIIIFLLFNLIYSNTKEKYYCHDWAKSLNDTYINNNETIYSCSIIIPNNYCLIDILAPLLDFSKLFNINCNKRKEEEKYLLKQISNLNNTENIMKIGYPITIGKDEEIKGRPAMYSDTLLYFVKNNLINLEQENQKKMFENNKKPEVYVDFTKDSYGKIDIKINFSKKLSDKRLELGKNTNSNNILFIFLDNLSRVHFYRQFKKTSKFLKTFLSFEGFSTKENPEQKYHGFEFIKYHNFQTATLHNAIPMFSGVYYKGENRMISIVKNMKEIGYITGNVQDICHKELMSIGSLENYSFIEFDHEYAAPNCDPNVYKYGFGFFSGENGMLRKCLYGKDSIEYSFEYGKKFWMAYRNNKKFLRIVNTYAHEYSGEKAKYSDNALYNFLNDLYLSEQLRNTTIFIAGDHGFALMGFYKLLNPKDWRIEQSMPIFILLVPDKKNITYEEEYSEVIKNQQNLITPFDIYYTLRDIIFGDEYKKNLLLEQNNEGESLFRYINPKERNCSKYEQINNCKCKLNNN